LEIYIAASETRQSARKQPAMNRCFARIALAGAADRVE